MSDRTNINFWLTLDHKPTAEEEATAKAIVDAKDPIDLVFDASDPWIAADAPTCGRHLCWSVGGYYNEGIPDEADSIATALHEAFPDAVEIRCWDDPFYEWLGTLTVYRKGETEARGASCDANGIAVYQAADILKIVDSITCPECERSVMNGDDHVYVCPECGYETSSPTDEQDAVSALEGLKLKLRELDV